MSDTKHTSEYKPVIEVGTVVHVVTTGRYKRWNGAGWEDVTEVMKKRKERL